MPQMKQLLNVTLVQANLNWEDAIKNRALFTSLLNNVKTDLIVLPEMFSTGFSMTPETLAEKEEGPTVQWMIELAEEKNAAVTGSLIIENNAKYYNRLFFVNPNGSYRTYDKRHLFTLAGEEKQYTAGDETLVVDYLGWKIKPLVCYDLRFPVWARNIEGYDLLIYIANWPAKRNHAWKSLLVARAIENQSYVVGLNRVGNDGNKVAYTGDSVILNALGETQLTFNEGEQAVQTFSISAEDLTSTRDRFKFLNDKDNFEINL